MSKFNIYKLSCTDETAGNTTSDSVIASQIGAAIFCCPDENIRFVATKEDTSENSVEMLRNFQNFVGTLELDESAQFDWESKFLPIYVLIKDSGEAILDADDSIVKLFAVMKKLIHKEPIFNDFKEETKKVVPISLAKNIIFPLLDSLIFALKKRYKFEFNK
jgi:hypothetical protein